MTEGATVYLDANVFIDFIEGDRTLSEPVDILMRFLRERPGVAITSKLTLAEVLAPTKGRKRHPPKRRLYSDLLLWNDFIGLRPITRDVLFDTTNLRATDATARLKLLDAIHLATAVRSHCPIFVSRDRGIPMPTGMRRIEANETTVAQMVETLR